jgi:hypothetical protein
MALRDSQICPHKRPCAGIPVRSSLKDASAPPLGLCHERLPPGFPPQRAELAHWQGVAEKVARRPAMPR